MDDVSDMEGEGEGERITGILYLITNDIDNQTYVGHTLKTPIQRLILHFMTAFKPKHANNKHYKHMRKILEKYGHKVFTMTPLETFTCNTVRELEKREQYWMDKLNPTLNTNRSYQTKKQKAAQQSKSYKKHYQKNKATILAKRNRKCVCLC